MKIKVENFRSFSSGNTEGFADVTLDGEVTICDVRLINGKNGFFAAMPSRKEKDGKYHENVRIMSPELKDRITEALMGAAGLMEPEENPFYAEYQEGYRNGL